MSLSNQKEKITPNTTKGRKLLRNDLYELIMGFVYRILFLLTLAGIIYLCASFWAYEIDPLKWDSNLRGICSLTFLMFSSVILFARYN